MIYDAAGNLTFDSYTGEGVRVYDAENRMTQGWANNQWQIYSYDGDGRRVKRKVNGAEVWQVYGVGVSCWLNMQPTPKHRIRRKNTVIGTGNCW